jgi:hypothetical protein
MEAVGSAETSVSFYRNTLLHVTKDRVSSRLSVFPMFRCNIDPLSVNSGERRVLKRPFHRPTTVSNKTSTEAFPYDRRSFGSGRVMIFVFGRTDTINERTYEVRARAKLGKGF